MVYGVRSRLKPGTFSSTGPKAMFSPTDARALPETITKIILLFFFIR